MELAYMILHLIISCDPCIDRQIHTYLMVTCISDISVKSDLKFYFMSVCKDININFCHLYILLLQCSSGVARHPGDLRVSVATRCFCRVLIFVSSWYLSVIYLFPVMIHWWVRKHSRGPNKWFEPWQKPRARVGSRKIGLSHPVF